MMEIVPSLALLPGPVVFFIGFLAIMTIYSGALLFTYWISKDE